MTTKFNDDELCVTFPIVQRERAEVEQLRFSRILFSLGYGKFLFIFTANT